MDYPRALRPLARHGLFSLTAGILTLTLSRSDQAALPAPSGGAAAVLASDSANYANNQRALDSELAALDASNGNASPLQWRDTIRNWYEANAGRFAAQTALGTKIQQETPVVNSPSDPPLPTNLSSDALQLLSDQRGIDAQFQQIQQQTSGSPPEARRDAMRAWYEQNSGTFAAQAVLASQVRDESEQTGQIWAAPNPIPQNATPAFASLLAAQASVDQEVEAIYTTNKGQSPTVTRDAIRDWFEHNQSELLRLQSLQTQAAE